MVSSYALRKVVHFNHRGRGKGGGWAEEEVGEGWIRGWGREGGGGGGAEAAGLQHRSCNPLPPLLQPLYPSATTPLSRPPSPHCSAAATAHSKSICLKKNYLNLQLKQELLAEMGIHSPFGSQGLSSSSSDDVLKYMIYTRSLGPRLLAGGPSGLLTSSFAPLGRSGRVTHAKET